MYHTTLIALGLLFSLSQWSFAVPVQKKALDKKIDSYLSEGVVVGGRAGQGFSLLNVRRDLSVAKKMERIILDIGDLEGRPIRGQAAYFHASIEKNPPRVVIDLAQLNRAGVNEQKLKQIFLKSPYVKKVELTSDPEDRSANMTILLKQKMGVEIFEMPAHNRTSRIIIDLKALVAKNSAGK